VIRSTSFLLRLGVSALLAATTMSALATSALAGSQVPLNGSFTETFNLFNPPPIIAAGGGNIQHLGLSTESSIGTIGTFNPSTLCAPDSSVSTITGASGVTVNVSAVGQVCITSYVVSGTNLIPTSATDSGNFTITGGTGKFVGATGNGPYTAALTMDPATGNGTSVETYN
jgi:hypothetical protein